MKRKIDLTTLGGLIVILSGIGLGYFLEGGDFGALIATSPILIIFGGTIGFAIITLPLSILKRVPGIFKSVFTEPQFDYMGLIDRLCELSAMARKKGIIALDEVKDEFEDPFVRRGLTLVADSMEPEVVKDFLESDTSQMMERHKQNSNVLDQMGAAAPTMGIIGTVLGLVVVLSGLEGSSTGELGHGIAVAFIATLMGVASANILWIPFSTKLKNKSAKEVLYRDIATYGILSIQAQESPLILRERLISYLPEKERRNKKEGEE